VARPGQATATGIADDWFDGRDAIDGRATAYVCHGTTCSLPVHEPKDLIAELVQQA
jgi:uncharacterized protein YyaL (SSP411 family)